MTTTVAEPLRSRRRLGHLVEAWTFPALTVALILFFSFLPETNGVFNTTGNFKIVLSSQSVNVLITLAVLVPVIVRVWDFTPGASAGMAAVVTAKVLGDGGSLALAMAAGLGSALAVGAVNAFLVVVMRVNSVIATLGMTIVISGFVDVITDQTSIVDGIPVGLTDFGSGSLLGIPFLALVAVGVLVFVDLLLRRTPFGRKLFATGSNRRAADLVGVNTAKLTMSAFLIGSLLAGMAGWVLLAQTGAGNPGTGPGFTLPAYAAVFLGTVAIQPGRWNVWGTACAIVFLAALSSGLVLAGASSAVTDFANGAALLVGVGVSNLVARKRGRTIEIE